MVILNEQDGGVKCKISYCCYCRLRKDWC